jgi:hypothetical protein
MKNNLMYISLNNLLIKTRLNWKQKNKRKNVLYIENKLIIYHCSW